MECGYFYYVNLTVTYIPKVTSLLLFALFLMVEQNTYSLKLMPKNITFNHVLTLEIFLCLYEKMGFNRGFLKKKTIKEYLVSINE